MKSPSFKDREHLRRTLDELAFLNQKQVEFHPEHAALEARMENYELACRMQMEVPDVLELAREPEHLREAYGLNNPETAAFGRQCLLARRLVEKGVRCVQIFSGGWDSHDYLERAHAARIRSVDQPMAALIRDLKQRGMLDETLVIWTGKFGRTPDNNKRGGVYSLGRGHNADAMTMLLAGGVFFAPYELVEGQSEANRRMAHRLHDAGIPVVRIDRDFVPFPSAVPSS